MRHRISGRSFGRRTGPKLALLRGLATSLIQMERITTTVAKAKELRTFVEPIITLAKRGDLHSRRLAAGRLYQKETLQKLFDEIGPRFKTRPGGYTRIFRGNQRQGDGAPLAIIELMDRPTEKKTAKKGETKKTEAKKTAPKKETEAKRTSAKKDAPKKAAPKAEKKDSPKKTTKKSSTSK